ncbi:MAG TPA: class I SAM-dependent methyltransferase [Gemmataceae bacterium]|nr:class I SAM-dependent methyltransferase [Gemmataceae bacterium]
MRITHSSPFTHLSLTSHQSSIRPLPETPEDALGPPIRERVIIDDKVFVIERPSDSDRLLDHPAIRAAFAADEYMPYWADLWPAARMLAKAVLREPWPPPPPLSPEAGERGEELTPLSPPRGERGGGEGALEVLEIGCGLGLPGIAALSRGLRVTFSDYDATALRFAAANARRNGFEEFRTLQFDWRYPPADLKASVLLASDLVYEMRNVAPLVALIKRVLLPGGLCLLTDADRAPAHLLREMLAAEGLAFTTQPMHAGEPGGRRVKGTLYRITHAD